MKIVAVNASPRKTWNTSKLVHAAADGAKSAGADTEIYDLYTLGKFSGCISCFGCMKEKHFGECVCNDALKPVLDSIRTADGLILGTPNYLGEATAAFRSLYERLIFQYITYNSDKFSANTRHIPVLFIMTSNAGDAAYEDGGMYSGILQNYKNTLSRFIGPANVLVAGDTLQVNDYSHYDWTMFDPVSKARRNEKVFPEKLSDAERMGREMAVFQ